MSGDEKAIASCNMPEYLYKYRSMIGPAKKYVKDTVVGGTVFFAKPTDFNDPFDFAPALSLKATDREFATYLEGLYKRRMPLLSRTDRRASVSAVLRDKSRNHRSQLSIDLVNKAVNDLAESIGIFSLSELPDHILMWSHYADSHRGVCLRFSSRIAYFENAQKVIYQLERPVANLILDKPMVFQNKAALYKADMWNYEKEWRIIDHSIPGWGVHQFPPEALDGVIFGAKTSEADKALIREWAAERKLSTEILQARIDKDSFRLKIEVGEL